MIDFVYKYEPIFIQRQISQTLQNVLEDPKALWRLNWYNDIKMPLLTTLLMFKSEISIEENMKKFERVVTLNSLTTDEMFMKNATKSNQMQMKAIEIVTDAMKKIMDAGDDNALREFNMDLFIQQLNSTLMTHDPAFAKEKGVTMDGPDVKQATFQSAEELAEEEAERERKLKEQMQAHVVDSVMLRIEGNMKAYDERVQETIESLVKSLNTRFAQTKDQLSSAITNLEQYLEDVHTQQINEFEILKKITFALASGASVPENELEQEKKKE